MKQCIYQLTAPIILLTVIIAQPSFGQKTQKITLEHVTERCKDLPFDKRMTIRVERFSVSNSRAQEQGEFGGELATMLTNALQKTNCFRVLETNANGADLSGDAVNAQLVVTGEITEFSEKNTNLIGIQKSKVTIGFILKVLNPQTSDILFSESVNGEGITSGFSSSIFTSSKLTGAIANASEQAIIRSVDILADKKDKIQAPVLEPVKKFNASNCTLFRNGKGPKIMILIPETQTTGGVVIDRKLTRSEREDEHRKQDLETLKTVVSIFKKNSNPPPAAPETNVKKTVVVEQATAEGVIINKFIEAGFRVIDPSVYSRLRDQDNADDKAKMAALGLKLGADIIITGKANSEQTPSKQEGNFTFRGMVDLRALATEDATVLASRSEIATADDRAESISAQKSLRNASNKMASYLLEQLCSRTISFSERSGGTSATNRVASTTTTGPSINTTEIILSNTDYNKLKLFAAALTKNPKVKSVEKSLKGTEGTLRIGHLGSTDEVIDALDKLPAIRFEVKNVEAGKASLTMN